MGVATEALNAAVVVSPPARVKTNPMTKLVSGPTVVIKNSAREEGGSCWMFETPPKRKRVMLRTGSPLRFSHQRVRQFVGQHRSKKQQWSDDRQTPSRPQPPIGMGLAEYNGQIPNNQQKNGHPTPIDVDVHPKYFTDTNSVAHLFSLIVLVLL